MLMHNILESYNNSIIQQATLLVNLCSVSTYRCYHFLERYTENPRNFSATQLMTYGVVEFPLYLIKGESDSKTR